MYVFDLHGHWAAVNNRGKSYNIRMDDEVLVKFSPKNPGSTYVFGDTVGGCMNKMQLLSEPAAII